MLRIFTLVLAMIAGVQLAAAQDAASFPTKPIRIILPFPAGGASDVISRAIGEALQPKLGQPLVIDNRPGANNMVGATEAMTAPNNGYTYLWGTSSLTSLNPVLYDKLPYNPKTTFDPVSLLYTTREFLIVNSDLGVNTLEEFIDLAKKKPGEINFASFGNGSLGHMIGLAFEDAAGIKLNHVPYRGMSEIVPDLLANRVQAVFTSVWSVGDQIKDGKIKVLALAAGERSPNLPDVPTFKDKGFNVEMAAFLALFAPAGTPLDIREKLASSISEVINSKEFRAKYTDKQDLVPVGSTPDEMAKFIAEDAARLEPIAKASGVKFN